jgi:protein O-GlcNAc transferase
MPKGTNNKKVAEGSDTSRWIDIELNKAIQYYELGQIREAERVCQNILEIVPNHADSLHLLALVVYQGTNKESAFHLVNKAISYNPNNPIYYNSLGNMFEDVGNVDEAISCYNEAVQLNPLFTQAYNNMGVAFANKGKLDEALSCYEKAVELDPSRSTTYNNMGLAFAKHGNFDKAISCYEKAADLAPHSAVAHNNMGNAFRSKGRYDEAIAHFRKALTLNPDYCEAYNNMGNVFRDKGDHDGAVRCYHSALELKPDYAVAHDNLGKAFYDLGRFEDAILSYRKALEFRSDLVEACKDLVHVLQRTCAWRDLEIEGARLDSFTEKAIETGKKPAEPPFVSLTRHADLSRSLSVAKLWSNHISMLSTSWHNSLRFNFDRGNRPRITIGYLSNDFRDHPIAHLMLGLLRLHNRQDFGVFCYSYGMDDGTHYRERIGECCNNFVDLCNIDDIEAAKHIYQDQIDILVDLTGYTEGNRLGICALRPAPVQVTYLGFPGTTGAPFFDYIITDKIVTPEHHAVHYSENLAYMPHCYMVTDDRQIVAEQKRREDFRLPERHFVFSSFNSAYKIEPSMFSAWMRILQEVPNSVLWLGAMNETARHNLWREAQDRGVVSERLIFAERIPQREQHLARLSLADLALDTRIYNGHATTIDALWTGVPVIALKGSHFASRVSASILTAIGLPDLITHTLEEYESLTVRLAHNRGELHEIRQRLIKNRLTEPLFATLRFVKNLEKTYKKMWETFLAGEKPRRLEIVENLRK